MKDFRATLNTFNAFIYSWMSSQWYQFLSKNGFCKFTWKTIGLIRFHVLVFTLNHKSVFSRSDDVTSPYSLLRDVTLLSILIGNVVLVVSQEKLSFTIVSITLLWVLYFEFKTKRVFEVLMTSQWCHKPLDQNYIWVQAVFYSLTHWEQ